jgi:hypothetical protein
MSYHRIVFRPGRLAWLNQPELDGSPQLGLVRPVYYPQVDMGSMVHQQHMCSCQLGPGE